jgi:hypothetical protein
LKIRLLHRWRRPRYEAAIFGISSGLRYPYPLERFHDRGEGEDWIAQMNSTTNTALTRWELIEL